MFRFLVCLILLMHTRPKALGRKKKARSANPDNEALAILIQYRAVQLFATYPETDLCTRKRFYS